jgi:hypothetical protein
MNGYRLEYVLSRTPGIRDIFVGFGNPDISVPRSNERPSVYILNTAPSSDPGEHWCVICLEEKCCYFFDSFAQPPESYEFTDFLKSCDDLRYNTLQVQGVLSQTCGHHCLYFCIKYGNGKKPEEIMKSYSKNVVLNDKMVYNFIRDNYGDVIAAIKQR